MVEENSPSDNDSVENSEIESPVGPTAGQATSGRTADSKEDVSDLASTMLEDSALAGTQPIARYFSFIFLLGVIGLVGMIFYWVMARFLIPLFLAALLVVIFRPLHRWMLSQTRGRQALAAMLTTLSILLAVLVPIALLIVMAAAEGSRRAETI